MRINVNGREYGSVEEMPADVREQYTKAMSMLADKDGNGIPDILERGNVSVSSGGKDQFVTSVQTESRYVIDGKQYNRLEDVPAELRSFFHSSSASRTPRLDAAMKSGVTFHLTWTTILAFLAALAATMLITWFLARN